MVKLYNRVHERRAEHEFLMQAISLRMVELEQQDEQVATKLDHDLKILYRKIALVSLRSTVENIAVLMPSLALSPRSK